MIKVKINKNNIVITGHAGYDEYGKDIVCASVSSIVITSVNLALKVDKYSLEYKNMKNKMIIDIKSDNEIILLIIKNMVDMLEELADTYKKNIKIIKEDRP